MVRGGGRKASLDSSAAVEAEKERSNFTSKRGANSGRGSGTYTDARVPSREKGSGTRATKGTGEPSSSEKPQQESQ